MKSNEHVLGDVHSFCRTLDVVLVSVLNLNILCTLFCVFIVDFEQVNTDWEKVSRQITVHSCNLKQHLRIYYGV